MAMDVETQVDNIYNAEQQHFQVGLHALRHARKHQVDSQYSKILSNVDILIFCIWWFAMVGHTNSMFFMSSQLSLQGFGDFPENHVNLAQTLALYVKHSSPHFSTDICI